jgi:hypothetical protein
MQLRSSFIRKVRGVRAGRGAELQRIATRQKTEVPQPFCLRLLPLCRLQEVTGSSCPDAEGQSESDARHSVTSLGCLAPALPFSWRLSLQPCNCPRVRASASGGTQGWRADGTRTRTRVSNTRGNLDILVFGEVYVRDLAHDGGREDKLLPSRHRERRSRWKLCF